MDTTGIKKTIATDYQKPTSIKISSGSMTMTDENSMPI